MYDFPNVPLIVPNIGFRDIKLGLDHGKLSNIENSGIKGRTKVLYQVDTKVNVEHVEAYGLMPKIMVLQKTLGEQKNVA